jgi:hypothetical protein
VALKVGGFRRQDTNFTFTVRFHERAKPLEVICDTEEIARIRIRALRASERARRAALRSPTLLESTVSDRGP